MIFPGSFVTFVIDIILTSDFHLWSVPRLGRDREDQNQNPELEPTMEFLEVCFAILKLHGFSTLRIQDPTTTVQDEDNVGLKADEGWSPLGGLDFRIFPTEPMWSHYQILFQDSKISQDWRKFGSLGSLSSMEFFLVSTNWRVVSLLDPFRGFPPDPGGSSQILQRSQKARDTLAEILPSQPSRASCDVGLFLGEHMISRDVPSTLLWLGLVRLQLYSVPAIRIRRRAGHQGVGLVG